jgi:hypothetical protein
MRTDSPSHETIAFRPRPPGASFLTSDAGLVLVAAAVAVACFVCNERVPVNGGFGWDGVQYGNWARHFKEEVLVRKPTPYYIQRVLPSGVVSGVLHLLDIPRTDEAILRAFGLYSAALLVLVAVCWCAVARELRLSPGGKWLGFVALFGSFLALKHGFYISPNTDVTGYALGMVLTCAYLRRNTFLLAAAIVAGAFSWPLCVHVGVIMLLFPRAPETNAEPRTASVRVRLVAALALTGIFLVAYRVTLRMPCPLQTVWVGDEYITPFRPTLRLSVLVVLAYVCAFSFYLFGAFSLASPRSLFTLRRGITLAGVGLGLAVLKYVQARMARPNPGAPEFYSLLALQTVYTSVKYPGVFLVTHISFFGPIVILAAFFWKDTCREMTHFGPAAPLCFLFTLPLTLNSQSRFFLNLIPLLVPFVIKALERHDWGPRQFVGFTAVALLVSKAWFTINTGPFTGRLHEFPDQGLFMNIGPWISGPMYVVQGMAFAFLGLVLYLSWFPRALAGQVSNLSGQVGNLSHKEEPPLRVSA